MFGVMDDDTIIKVVKAFGVGIGQLIDDVRVILFFLIFAVVFFVVWLPDLIFQGMKKFDRWKKEQEE
jgi:hypothetical protein